MQISQWQSIILALACFIQFSSSFHVTGARGGRNASTGSRPFRLEIRDLAQAGPAWDLYIQALSQMQAKPQSDPLSYFQIAGIHGYPRMPWDNVKGTDAGPPGYCTHGATTFPPWHRPYLALFEQVLCTTAQSIASSYTGDDQSTYVKAAQTLRIPYWDWASNLSFPDVMQRPTLIINTTNGEQEMENPLYDYNFHWGSEGNIFLNKAIPLADFNFTVRRFNNVTLESNQSEITAALRANAGSITSKTYQLFTDPTDYSTFSCVRPNGINSVANNIEVIHGVIHNIVGGYGHMFWPEVSAFDPVFWLHHANVDRLFAMWQVLNPESYMIPGPNVYGSFFEAPGTINSGNSSLAPFHATENGTIMWTSDTARNLSVFNYAYPEMPDWALSGETLANYVRLQINQKYNPGPPPNTSIANQRNIKRNAIPWTDDALQHAFRSLTPAELYSLHVNNAPYQWTIRITMDRYAYNSAFSLDFFMGPPLSDIASWPTAPNLIGTHSSFIAADVAAMFPGSPPAGLAQGEVSLTHTLAAAVERGYLRSLAPEDVLPGLKKVLQWRARLPDGREVDVGKLTGLRVQVGSKFTIPAVRVDQFPRYGSMVWWPEAVEGKVGGGGTC